MAKGKYRDPDYKKKYNAANRERVRAVYRDWCERNREHLKELKRAYKKKRRARETQLAKESQARCWRRDPTKIRAKNKAWMNRNRERMRIIGLRDMNIRRARLKGGGGSHTHEEWLALLDRYGHHCLCCRRMPPEVKLTRDHVVPVACGGSDNIDNIQPLCKPCNSKKKHRVIDYRPNWVSGSTGSTRTDIPLPRQPALRP